MVLDFFHQQYVGMVFGYLTASCKAMAFGQRAIGRARSLVTCIFQNGMLWLVLSFVVGGVALSMAIKGTKSFYTRFLNSKEPWWDFYV